MDRLVAIDPLALILRNDIYVKINLPRPPDFEITRHQVREIAHGMSPNERAMAIGNARALAEYAKAMAEELGKLG